MTKLLLEYIPYFNAIMLAVMIGVAIDLARRGAVTQAILLVMVGGCLAITLMVRIFYDAGSFNY